MLFQNTSDSAYAYSGYAPLIVRILEEGDRVRWTGWHKTFDGSVGGILKTLSVIPLPYKKRLKKPPKPFLVRQKFLKNQEMEN